MAKAYALRSGGSGPVFDGNADDVLTLQADGTAKFLPPGGGGGSVEPLTLEFWVDQGRAGSTQDGSIANPFLTIQNGIDAIEASLAGTGSLLVADGDYSAEELSVPLAIAIIATGKPITVAKLGSEAVRSQPVRLVNVRVTGETWLIGGLTASRIEGGGLLGDVDLTGEPVLEGVNAEFGDVTCADVLGVLTFRSCTVKGVLGADGGFHADTVRCWDSTITENGIEAENVFLNVSPVTGGVTAHRATLVQSAVADGLIVANTLISDTYSLTQARALVVAQNPEPLLTTLTDHHTSFGVLTVPAIEQGSFAEVNIGAPGLFAREGDVVLIALANTVEFPRLANIGIANAWINADGSATVRFFGTTAGGTQTYNISLIPHLP